MWRTMSRRPWLVRKITHFQPNLSMLTAMWAEVTVSISMVTITLYVRNQREDTPDDIDKISIEEGNLRSAFNKVRSFQSKVLYISLTEL